MKKLPLRALLPMLAAGASCHSGVRHRNSNPRHRNRQPDTFFKRCNWLGERARRYRARRQTHSPGYSGFPALIALIPLQPLCVLGRFLRVALRTAWGLAVVGQWLLSIAALLDIQRGLLARSRTGRTRLARQIVVRHSNGGRERQWPWAASLDFLLASWITSAFGALSIYCRHDFLGIGSIMGALRWRSSSSWATDLTPSTSLVDSSARP